MNKAPAFQFYADDFLGGVADMTQAEIGAYIMLLCAQWNRGAIPTDPNRAALIAKGEVTPHVLAKFPDGKNPRLEAVRAEQEAYRELQAEKGRASARARLNRGSTAVQPKGQPKANPPSPSPTPIINTPIVPKGDDRAEEIYDAYPRRIAKQAALKAILRALQTKPAADLLAATRAFAAAVAQWPESERQYIPHPATWYNRGSYEDDPAQWVRTAPRTAPYAPPPAPYRQMDNLRPDYQR